MSSRNALPEADGDAECDELFMSRAILLGERARGLTGDNPHVGSVIVRAGRTLGEGWTSEPGRNHAEINALEAAARAGFDVRGATLYATVEPCSFVGRTPACSLTIIERGIARVVFGIRDPHPRVNGRGAEQLRLGGLEVREGQCAAQISTSLSNWLAGFAGRAASPVRASAAHSSLLAQREKASGGRSKPR
jgi:diaminohydroxyphosphoribosylaminopyrimidine deaminase/5-amino-6-(5-phosphoribosylamino)uracil reductase